MPIVQMKKPRPLEVKGPRLSLLSLSPVLFPTASGFPDSTLNTSKSLTEGEGGRWWRAMGGLRKDGSRSSMPGGSRWGMASHNQKLMLTCGALGSRALLSWDSWRGLSNREPVWRGGRETSILRDQALFSHLKVRKPKMETA